MNIKSIFNKINEYVQNEIFIDYTIIDQVENGSYEEGEERYTYSFYVTPKSQDWIYQVSVNDLLDGFQDCLEWLDNNSIKS